MIVKFLQNLFGLNKSEKKIEKLIGQLRQTYGLALILQWVMKALPQQES